MDFETFRAITRPSHIVVGGVILLTGLLQLTLKKGGRRHRILGSIYLWAMFASFLTSFPASIHTGNYFLAIIGIFSLYLAFTGARFAQIKASRKVHAVDRLGAVLFSASAALMIVATFVAVVNGQTGSALILGIFGGIFASGAFRDLMHLVIRPNMDAQYTGGKWMGNHIGRMVGSYIAAVTAFLVNVQPFGTHVVNWLLPTLVGSFLIRYFLIRFRPKN